MVLLLCRCFPSGFKVSNGFRRLGFRVFGVQGVSGLSIRVIGALGFEGWKGRVKALRVRTPEGSIMVPPLTPFNRYACPD